MNVLHNRIVSSDWYSGILLWSNYQQTQSSWLHARRTRATSRGISGSEWSGAGSCDLHVCAVIVKYTKWIKQKYIGKDTLFAWECGGGGRGGNAALFPTVQNMDHDMGVRLRVQCRLEITHTALNRIRLIHLFYLLWRRLRLAFDWRPAVCAWQEWRRNALEVRQYGSGNMWNWHEDWNCEFNTFLKHPQNLCIHVAEISSGSLRLNYGCTFSGMRVLHIVVVIWNVHVDDDVEMVLPILLN